MTDKFLFLTWVGFTVVHAVLSFLYWQQGIIGLSFMLYPVATAIVVGTTTRPKFLSK